MPQSDNQSQSSLNTPIVLTIAGSDSGGGAGIQADIKAISATGGYACSVITAITSQNTQGVSAILPVPVEHVESQLDAVFSDLDIVAVKIGMLADSNIIAAVARKLRQYQPRFVVLDPVMVATSGDLLLQSAAIDSLQRELLPLATLITPNLPEAAALTGLPLCEQESQLEAMSAALRALPCQAVLLKGGHLPGTSHSDDWLLSGTDTAVFRAQRVDTQNTHGTGCTLSSAIACYLAQGFTLQDAIRHAKHYISRAIAHADELDVGRGHGPVHHFFALSPIPSSQLESL
ncbi:bifunctional hydroxymethylpyrimidine kinase/phosphomethylpyrimidine kinase [Vibrio sp. ABG19]|uniref:bifunctional hydroxymethylpyrimidine kinase/phosphomethylpyrimidine kinase n=1 Tax=Vibrio sp. ABG19 TaxID=2817385 RepID=UPI00249F7A4C|nr:bifunctional hydroxymethylpyrimidine kinase/phosphomethylpyrimidine kinase [Vibrio sp. ABG19]WGY47297.1 bifunctional hydroxymethylpyrimidine kinase/phosphomethylpyrimidine kinase [Vibrio sp. ABG19]